jgi:chemosensory pili system protein ChpA (sensor histidine kinase/response regulator)/putative two-component system response regulator
MSDLIGEVLAPAGAVPSPPRGGIDPRRKNRIVMCVDDDDSTLSLISTVLGGAGYSVVPCKDAADGLSRLVRFEARVILVDLQMPQTDGFTFIAELKRRFRALNAKIVVVSARHDKEDVLKARSLGADDYVLKPFRPQRLLDRVDHWMGIRAA